MSTSLLLVLLFAAVLVREVAVCAIFLRDPQVRRLALQGLARLRRRRAWFLASLGVFLALQAGSEVSAQPPAQTTTQSSSWVLLDTNVKDNVQTWVVSDPSTPDGVVTVVEVEVN